MRRKIFVDIEVLPAVKPAAPVPPAEPQALILKRSISNVV